MKNSDANMSTPFWRDNRVIPILFQLLFVAVLIGVMYYLINNAINGLQALGINLGFDFLQNMASFNIGESIIEYQSTDTYMKAILVGILNTIKVSVIGIVFATIIGVIVGISRLSSNWLVQKLATIYIEIFRNTPLLVQILIWYFAVFLALPDVKESVKIGPIFLSNRGAAIPWFHTATGSTTWLILFLSGVLLAVIVWRYRLHIQVKSGKKQYPLLWGFLGLVFPLVLAWLLTQQAPITIESPVLGNFNFEGGYIISENFLAIFLALTIYTATYIAEIVRGGILSVSKGQMEASSALGLKYSTSMRFVVFPQAIRIIIPPVTSQYLNLTKNSSLAIAAGYPDLVYVAETINNQTGRAIQSIVIMITVYLILSIITSVFMNVFNNKVQIVER
ncbi:amino acid ABC transporter permease [Gracilibacillus thailandensis]|uniref:ABC transporter permease subunit n=2 Tax=Gracilibacillus thailandensis TaxID=563735 RepID=A0A6N7R5M2_9BACI|nr:ABC transporter permease subunit [Gracilibacillus thailandensis]MRI68454.1 ABC transporter permease subunit [Gracilibacillus thailandensis]